jgi:hypothetical protein
MAFRMITVMPHEHLNPPIGYSPALTYSITSLSSNRTSPAFSTVMTSGTSTY